MTRAGIEGLSGQGMGVAECFGCGDLTSDHYRDLPLCIHCQQECTLLNQLFALPSESPEKTAARETREIEWFLRGYEIGERVRIAVRSTAPKWLRFAKGSY